MPDIAADWTRKVEKLLRIGGGTHELQDILDAIKSGSMQSFVSGDSWAVTQVAEFPRKRVLEVLFLVGRLEDVPALRDQVEAFGRAVGADFVRAYGRPGWEATAKSLGWQPSQRIFAKDLA